MLKDKKYAKYTYKEIYSSQYNAERLVKKGGL